MNKSELLQWLKEEHQAWKAVIDQFTSSNWEKPGVTTYWSMKDTLAHLIGWNRQSLANMLAVSQSKPKPSPPWPPELESDDEINAWFCETNRERSVKELLSDEKQVFKQVLGVVKSFPDDVEIETLQEEGREYYLVHLNGQRLHPGEFFDHYRDDHEAKISSFLKKQN